MKSLSNLMLVLLLCLTTATSYSQATSKPKLFSNFPNSINCQANEFRNAFTAAEGQHIVLTFSDNFKFSGTVTSNVVKYSNLQTMTIKSDLSDNTIFHLSKQVWEDNRISFTGRIMSPDAADGYQILKDQADNYKFEKIDAGRVLQDCHL